MKERGRRQAKTLTAIALSVALITVCAWLAVPFTPPFTLQTFALFFTLCLLGGRDGTFAVLAYLLLGVVGAPVFSGFGGGVTAFFGAGGGYLIGFLCAALLFWGLEKILGKTKKGKTLLCFLALTLCYLVGTVWFATVYLDGAGTVGFGGAILACVLPYLLPDAIKILLAVWVSERVKKKWA